MKYSACIEWLFAEVGDFPDRIRAAKKAGLDGIEFWLWTNKDIGALHAAVKETGIAVTGMVAEPMVPLTDPAQHAAFLEGLKRSIATAQRLGAPALIAQAGADLPDRTRAEQRAALVACLSKAADVLRGSGVILMVEPLNTRVDHAGYFLPSTTEGLDIIAHVHLADAPGRHEPGTGTMDWQRRLDWLDSNGYRGMVGLEYKPTRPTPESLAALLSR